MARLVPLFAVMMFALPALAGDALRVMSFNVRLPNKSDGPNYWDHRRDLLVATIREKAPDIFGTQELHYHQGQYIAEHLDGYAWFGRSRRGNREDEHMGVFYRKDRLKLIESGDFWLSETPDVPGSISWEMSLPRMVTWGLFETAGGRRFYFYNTHLAHRRQDAEARLRSAQLIAARISRLPADIPVVLTGDFNAPAGGDVYGALTARLTDAWTAAPRRSGPEGTFNAFRGETGGPRIDWILYRGALRAAEAETVTRNDNGRYPSDHFPVLAVLEWQAESSGWKPMFDGRTLAGWRETPFRGRGPVRVENGAIVLGPGEPLTGITWTGSFPRSDYEVRFEAARLEGSDFFAALTFPVADSFCTWVAGGWGGDIVGLSNLDGWDAADNDTRNYFTFEKGRWYAFRLRVKPDRITAWIDDEAVVDVGTAGRYVSLREGEIELSAPFGFASYATAGGLRKIEYRPLPPAA